MDIYQTNPGLRDVIDLIRGGFFSRGDAELFRPLIDGLLYQDPYLLLADFQPYVDCQAQVSEAYRDTERWTRMSILNTARSGKFSSDRTISEYCADIWQVQPVPIHALTHAEAGAA
jgi:starch phosphorylase